MKTTVTKPKTTIIGRRNIMRGIIQASGIPKSKLAMCLMAILFTCLWADISFASWSQLFTEDGVYDTKTYKIIKIEVFKLDGTSGFENPGMSSFSKNPWTVDMPNDNYIIATNTKAGGTNNFNWIFSFTGTSTDSLHLAYLAYTNSNKVFGQYIDFNYGSKPSWSFPTIQNLNINNPAYNRSSASSVPIPPAVYMFGAGLLSLVGLRKKIIN
jgi:hypothetical protein